MRARRWSVVVGVLLLAAAAAAVWWWMRDPAPAPVASVEPAAPLPVEVEPEPAAAPEPEPPPPDLRPDETPLPAEDEPVRSALTDLLGREAALRLLQTDGFARRVAATVDNLPRQHAAPRLWPVNPTEGRFAVDESGRIAAANARRYDALLNVVLATDPATAASLYRRLLPQLQSAYEELGYPRRSFHARAVAVLDHLLGTPALPQPPQLALTDVRGSVPSERPWVRYEYVDEALESASAGRRILWRLGDERQRRVQDWLRRLRAEIAALR